MPSGSPAPGTVFLGTILPSPQPWLPQAALQVRLRPRSGTDSRASPSRAGWRAEATTEVNWANVVTLRSHPPARELILRLGQHSYLHASIMVEVADSTLSPGRLCDILALLCKCLTCPKRHNPAETGSSSVPEESLLCNILLITSLFLEAWAVRVWRPNDVNVCVRLSRCSSSARRKGEV